MNLACRTTFSVSCSLEHFKVIPHFSSKFSCPVCAHACACVCMCVSLVILSVADSAVSPVRNLGKSWVLIKPNEHLLWLFAPSPQLCSKLLRHCCRNLNPFPAKRRPWWLRRSVFSCFVLRMGPGALYILSSLSHTELHPQLLLFFFYLGNNFTKLLGWPWTCDPSASVPWVGSSAQCCLYKILFRRWSLSWLLVVHWCPFLLLWANT